ncbi:methionine-R-sulfoxide reductase B1 isoform X1 [Polyergus mexicanus]|uniref:methionine-R-sulfoxide reductase B1 isoform X1 n=1 Tax=Polyergus mexicanus TaxID=615972 RepID=UPI0038B529BA
MTTVIDKEEARKRLTPLQWHVTQEKGTERPFSGCYNKFYEKGTYTCIVCDQELFSSDTKYDSGCGWPAFNEVLDQGRIKLTKDISHALFRSRLLLLKSVSREGCRSASNHTLLFFLLLPSLITPWLLLLLPLNHSSLSSLKKKTPLKISRHVELNDAN